MYYPATGRPDDARGVLASTLESLIADTENA
jgi:hypothetical protein